MRNNSSQFSSVATVDKPRSTFNRDCTVKTTFNVGDIVPFYLDEVLPGDTFNIKTNKLVRLSTPITPFMDDLYLDTYYFYVPMRLVWDKTKEFFGENTRGHWYPSTEYQIPQITTNEPVHYTLWDYFGLPMQNSMPGMYQGYSVNALPFRAYGLIWNEFFRDENLQDPVLVRLDSTTAEYDVEDPTLGGRPLKACKLHDYFTSCLPAPQKGPAVEVPIDSQMVYPQAGFNCSDASGFVFPNWKYASPTGVTEGWYGLNFYTDGASQGEVASMGSTHNFVLDNIGQKPSNQQVNPFIANLATEGSVAFSINELRNAFQLQRFYELSARGGSRYRETILAHFGVTNPDARVQIPEYLGGNRVNLNVNQVLQNSESSSDSPLGETGAYSLTTDSNNDFVKSFSEHGYIIGLAVCRYNHTYQSGMNRMWSRKNMTDFYFPAFANIGEQPVLNKEINSTGGSYDDEVFGYQEAWAEYRYKPSYVTANMRSNTPDGSLDFWHFADDYGSQLVTLSSNWIMEEKSNVDRCLSVTSEVTHQLIADFYIQNKTTRVMPLYSIPGLIDHN